MSGTSEATKNTLEKVSDELQSECMADLKEGREQALAVIDSSYRGAVEEVSKVIENGTRQAEALKRQMVGSAELESRNALLRAMEEAENEVFASASRRLSRLTPSEQEASLTRLVAEGVEVIGPNAEVGCNSEQKKLVSAVLRKLSKHPAKLTLQQEPIKTIGGVVLTSPNKEVRFDNTYEARLERLRPQLRKEVSDLLTSS